MTVATGTELEGTSIAIAGGGLGGLSAALDLAHHGAKVTVFEKQAHIRPIGYGIQIGPNVFGVLDRLGVREAVLKHAIIPKSIAMLDARNGSDIGRIPVNDEEFQRHFSPYIVIHREDIHAVMLEACRATTGITLRENAAVLSYENRAGCVNIRLQGGESHDFDVLVGADGLGSVVRKAIIGDRPQPNGYVAHRTILPLDQLPDSLHKYLDDVILWAGPHCHIVHYPLRANSVFNIVVVFRSFRTEVDGDADSHRLEAQVVYHGLHPDVQTLISLVDYERRWVLGDFKPVRKWTDGRIALLGDAAHATFQTLAQGAGMALEDAPALTDALIAGRNDVPNALQQYARGRLPRTARVQVLSRIMWPEYHLADEIECEVRRHRYAEMGREEFYDCLRWLWLPAGADPRARQALA